MLNRVSLNTIGLNRIGLNRIGKPSRGSSDRPYIDPEVLASLKAVCICYGKSNDDPDRAIVKNLVDPDNPFVISNAAFKLNSGFGKYETELSDTRIWTKSKDVTSSPFSSSYNGLSGWIIFANTELTNSADIPSFKIEVKGLLEGQELIYRYYDSTGQTNVYSMTKDGEYTLPADVRTAKPLTSNTSGFQIVKNETNTITITQIPSFEGAFVTDGIDDLITSTKTVQEMLGGSNEITVVSMIHQIKESIYNNRAYTNYISGTNGHIRNQVANTKTGIYGYTVTDLNSTSVKGSVINNILGDKNDYLYDANTSVELGNAKYSVQNYLKSDGTVSNIGSQLAWYWTIIANKVLTTDQINQVIAYFNLDRTLKSDIYCNIAKQGITNENHAEFGDKLIDFSGNGRDIQLNNIAWKGDSGIGKYNFSNINIIASNRFEGTITTNKCHFTKKLTDTTNNFCDLLVISPNEPIKFKVSGLSDGRKLFVANKSGSGSNYNFDNGEHEVSLSFAEGVGQNNPFGVTGDIGDIDVTVEFIPSHAGALCLDGVNDFGKVTGMPIYKDYTFISKYQRLSYIEAIETKGGAVIASKSYSPNQGAFIFNGVRGDYAHDCYSFGLSSNNNLINDKNLEVYYQTKYTNQGKSISSGTAADSDILWLGTVRDNDTRFINAAIYFLMSFPYSMSEFLIERQLKKHKLGTLYPDMVEFRPIIKHDDRITAIKYYHIKGSSWINLKPGDYIPVGSKISITTNLKSPYTIANVMSSSLTDIKVVPSAGGRNAYDILGYVTDKSPQKITMDIQVDSSLVQWNPVVESNVPYKYVKYYKLVDTSWKAINVGDYVLVGQRILTQIATVGIEDEVVAAVSEQLDIYGINKNSNGEYNILGITSSTTPQNINITIDEYIRYEDIVQPYPGIANLKQGDKVISYGDKLKVGSEVLYWYSTNLLPNFYSISGAINYNGNIINTNSTIVVEKSMVFSPIQKTWLLDNNEPKVILSPRLLRIPNSSYKILGYIPDISGHGNHGKINNSAYAGMSGANGYVENFTKWIVSKPPMTVEKEELQVRISYIGTSYKELPMFEYSGPVNEDYSLTVEVQGIPNNVIGKFIHNNGFVQEVTNGINTIKFSNSGSWYGFTFYREDNSIIGNCDITIKQIGEYEGAYCLDGVDDFVTIPTTVGGKQVLMKVNWQKNDSMIYNQNPGEDNFAIFANDYNGSNVVKAYASRNNGSTYIDSILNNNILATQLKNVIHNITIANENVVDNTIVPVIGANAAHNNFYAQMALYDFMLFDNISTEDKIKELNEYVGIEAKVELPPYYWDAYGKTNLDADKATIQQRGIAVGDYDITNYNHAYDKMSGFGGYSLGRFDKSWASSSSNNTSVVVVQRNPYDITLKKLGGNSDWEFNNTELKVISNPVSVKFKSNKNIRVTCDYHYYPVGGNSEGTPLGITSKDLIANKDAIITISPISQENIDKYNIDVNRGYYLIYFQLSSTLAVNEEVTIEMLPLYPNGLVYDGVTDYSKNANIPALTDYTYVFKRDFLYNANASASMYSGSWQALGGGAFISDFCVNAGGANDGLYGFSFGNSIKVTSLESSKIIYGTKTSVNGTNITPGSNIGAGNSITLGKFGDNYRKFVFYKLILYPKTIPLLQINFLKNLMERDEIIDLNNKIFIQE